MINRHPAFPFMSYFHVKLYLSTCSARLVLVDTLYLYRINYLVTKVGKENSKVIIYAATKVHTMYSTTKQNAGPHTHGLRRRTSQATSVAF